MSTKKISKRDKKKIRIRKKISGTTEKPRLCVYRSLSKIYAQIVDDSIGKILFSASTLSKEISDELKDCKGKVDQSELVGSLIAKKAVAAGISTVVFDRSGYSYNGRVKAVAEGARKGGLQF